MAAIQIRKGSIHATVEAIQDESGSREGAIEVSGAGAEVGCGGCDSDKEVIGSDIAKPSHGWNGHGDARPCSSPCRH
jgi:hypothetical protein